MADGSGSSRFEQRALTPGRARRTVAARWLQRLASQPTALLSATFLITLVAAALFASQLTPYAMEGAGMPNMGRILLAPSLAHPFGTDEMGRDLLARVLYGARTSLALATLVVGSSIVVGIVVGLVAGTAGSWLDETAMRTTDIFLAFPPLLLAILVVAVLGGGFTSAVLALALAWWPLYAVLVRGQVVSVRGQPFIEAAEATGASPVRIAWRHLLPNALGPLLVQVTIDVGGVILVAAGLSFIGLGPQPPTADWGLMVATGRQFVLSGSWWVAGFPGLAIMATTLAFALLGDALRAGDRT